MANIFSDWDSGFSSPFPSLVPSLRSSLFLEQLGLADCPLGSWDELLLRVPGGVPPFDALPFDAPPFDALPFDVPPLSFLLQC